jgi:hypothetical protein
MLIADGMVREQTTIAGVLTTLADAGLLRAGAVLVRAQAFANILGMRLAQQTLQNADGDHAMRIDILETLRASDPRFVAVPGLDPHHPSTSFKVRGRDLRVDLLTPGSRDGAKPVHLPHLNAAAQPLPGLRNLLAKSTEAAVVAGAGVLVQIPAPAAFALHKLRVEERRPVSEQQKARKDRRQAAQLIEVVAEDRPLDLRKAWKRLPARMVSGHRTLRR